MADSWRAAAVRTISAVIQDVGLEDMDILRAALFRAYPFGERARYPYRVWRQEVRAVLTGKRPAPAQQKKRRRALIAAGQLTLPLEE